MCENAIGKATHPVNQKGGIGLRTSTSASTSASTSTRPSNNQNQNQNQTTPATANEMSRILSLFSALRSGESKTPSTVYEDTNSDGVSMLQEDASSTQP